MMHRNNIEIDYCPSCRGVWLDRGELDKMLEFAASQAETGSTGNQYPPNYSDQHRYDKTPYGHKKPYKKKSFLGDLFDFD